MLKQRPRELPVNVQPVMRTKHPFNIHVILLKNKLNVEVVPPGVAGQCAAQAAHEAPFRDSRNLVQNKLNVEAVPPGVAGQCAAHVAHEAPFRR